MDEERKFLFGSELDEYIETMSSGGEEKKLSQYRDQILDNSLILLQDAIERDVLRSRMGSRFDTMTLALLDKVFADNRDHCAKRLEHTLKRLKARGLWSDNPMEVMDLYAKIEDPMMRQRVLYAFSCMGILNLRTPFTVPLSDGVWMFAIEYTMLLFEPKLFLDDKALWARTILNHLDFLFPFVVLLSCYDYCHYLEERTGEVADQVHEVLAYKDNWEQHQTNVSQKDQRIRQLEDKLRGKLEEVSSLHAEYGKKIAALERQVREQQEELDALSVIFETDEVDSTVDFSSEESEDADVEISNKGLLELPEDGVLFVGGYPGLLSRIQKQHPKWAFMETDAEHMVVGSSVKICFVWYRLLSHKVYHRVRDSLPKGAKLIYLKCNGHRSLDHEMREKYTEYAESLE